MKTSRLLNNIFIFTIVIFFFYSLPSILYAETQSPTESQVREAVANYFGDDKVSTIARHNLRTWGNQALPHLKKMALEKASKENSWELVVSIQEIQTKEAIDLLIEIADDKTYIDPECAVSIFFTMVNNKNTKGYLENQPRFKEVIYNLASYEDLHTRGNIAYIMGKMGWKDSLPIFKEMLNDNILTLREDAANAIFHLTGEKVSVRRPQTSFPGVKLKDNLVKYIGKLPKKGWMTSSSAFDYWFNGKRGLLRWDKESIILHGPDLKPLASLKTNKMSHDFLMLLKNQKRPQLVALVSDEYMPRAGYVVSLDVQGNELWQYRPARSGIEAIAPLYNRGGDITGVIIGVGGSEGIVALNHEGKILWNIPNYHVLYEIKVNSSLPNRVAACGGSICIFDESGKQIVSNSSKKDAMYAHHIEIFKDEQNKMSLIATGSGEMTIPTIIRYDETLTPIWKAQLPHAINGLAMLESKGTEKLFVVATAGGELLIFDQNGILKYQDTLLRKKDDGFPVYGIKAGFIGDDKYAFSIGTLSGILIYEFILK